MESKNKGIRLLSIWTEKVRMQFALFFRTKKSSVAKQGQIERGRLVEDRSKQALKRFYDKADQVEAVLNGTTYEYAQSVLDVVNDRIKKHSIVTTP